MSYYEINKASRCGIILEALFCQILLEHLSRQCSMFYVLDLITNANNSFKRRFYQLIIIWAMHK